MAQLRKAGRRNQNWAFENLHPLYDALTLESGRFFPAWQGARIQSMEDARLAWEANRHLFMRMCRCYQDTPRCRDHDFKHNPGERPWAYWTIELGYAQPPADQSAELERLKLIGKEERAAIEARRAK